MIKIFSALLFLLTLFIGQVNHSSAQNPFYFETFNNLDGLSSDVVVDIIKDSEGFLWFATEDGLNRYDGYSFKTFRKDYNDSNSLIDNKISAIAEDSSGNLWIGTMDKGLSVYDKSTGKFLSFTVEENEHRLPTNNIRSLYIDNYDNVWVGTENFGILKITPEKEVIVYRTRNRNLSEITFIKTIFQDRKNNIWFGTWAGNLYLYDQQKDDFNAVEIFPNGALDVPINSIYEDNKGRFWLGTWGGGLYIAEGSVSNGFEITNHLYLHKDFLHNNTIPLAGDIIFSIAKGAEGVIWVGTNNGIALFDVDDLYNPTLIKANANTRFAPDNSQISKVYADDEGLLWLGTKGSGIHKVNLHRHKLFSKYVPFSDTNIFEETAVFSIFEKNDTTLLLGVKSEGFYHFNKNTEKFTPFREFDLYTDFTKINTAYAFQKDEMGRVWMGTRYEGLFILDYENEKIESVREEYPGFNARKVYTIKRDVDNRMWVGTDNGLFIFNKQNSKSGQEFELLHHYHNPGDNYSLSDNNVISIMQDSRGEFWIGTLNNGVNRYKNTSPSRDMMFEVYKSKIDETGSIPSNRINDIFEDSQGQIWLATEGGSGGLALYDPLSDSFRVFGKKNGLIGDHVYSILEDKRSRLWISTNKGIQMTDLLNSDNPEFISFTISDGLQGNVYIRNSSMIDSEGFFYFGGYNGFNAFKPENIEIDLSPPRVAVTRLMLRDRSIQFNPEFPKPIIVSNKDKVITVDFTVLAYKDPGNNRFAYQLEGFDKDWVYRDATGRQAVYTNLRRGKYTLKIRASNSNGVWSEEPIEIGFVVKPPLMASNVALLIYVILLGLTGYGITRMVVYRARMKQQLLLEKLEQRKMEQVHQLKLRSFANVSHELLTPLSVINCVVDNYTGEGGNSKDSVSLMKKNVRKLKKLIDQLLLMRKIDTGHMKLSVRESNFKSFLYDIYNAFVPLAESKDLSIDIVCNEDEITGYFDSEKLEMIIQNLLSNSLKFTDSGYVRVHCNTFILANARWLGVSVEDTGCGISQHDIDKVFERFTRVNKNQLIPGMGIGLDLVKNLTSIHKGRVNVDSQEGKGTVFTIEIPIGREFYDADEISNQPLLNQHHDEAITSKGDDSEAFILQDTFENKDNAQASNVKSLLLVEDNDDLRQIVKEYLSRFFDVEEAEDGESALEIAKYLSPDIIVSDVIMPNMNGFELCTKIKSDIETSHIPIILLTAKVDDTSKTEAYSYGADSYLTKPVNMDLLLTRINSILDAREGLKEYYRRRCIFAPEASNVSIPPLDETYIKRATEIIEQNIENPEFSVQTLTHEMGTSNSMLYRKFNKILGVTPNELIKNLRIRYAAEMLGKGTYTVSEVAYSIGFNDLSYFGKCFKKAYGVAPSDYKEKQSAV